MLLDQAGDFPNNVRNFLIIESKSLQIRHITSALIGDVFEEIYRISNQRFKAEEDENLLRAFNSLRELAGITLRLKKCWLKMFSIQTAAVNRENLAEFYLLLQNVKFHASTYFNRYFEDALKEMYKFFQQNPDVEICIAHTMSLYPLETLLESLKLFNTSPRTLTNEIVEDNLFFLSQGAVLTNLQTSCLNGYLAFLRAD